MLSGAATLDLLMAQTRARGPLGQIGQGDDKPSESAEPMTLFLCGDVMTGRGIDQVLPHPGDPRICESYMTSALGYVDLAEKANGPIRRLRTQKSGEGGTSC